MKSKKVFSALLSSVMAVSMVPLNSFTSVAVEGNAGGYIKPFKDRNISVLYDDDEVSEVCDRFNDFYNTHPFDSTMPETYGSLYDRFDNYYAFVDAFESGYGYGYSDQEISDIESFLDECASLRQELINDIDNALFQYENACYNWEYYTEDSFHEFEDAYWDAQDCRNYANATIEELTNACQKLRDAYNALKEAPADYTELDNAIERANQVDTSLYTEETVLSFNNWFEEAKSVSRDLTYKDQITVTVAAYLLNDAIDSLVRKPVFDYTEVINLMEDADYQDAYYNQEAYVYDTWATYEAFYDAVKDYYDYYMNGDGGVPLYTQEDINASVNGLKQAYNDLVKIEEVNTDELMELLNQYSEIEDSFVYTAESWNYYENTYNECNAYFETQDEVDNAVDKLKNAYSALKRRADYSKIEQRIEEVRNSDDFQKGYYTEDSLQKFNRIAEGIVYDYNFTGQYSQYTDQMDVDDLYVTLSDAIKDFEYKYADTTRIEEAVRAFEAIENNEAQYDPAKWAVAKAAYDEALTVLSNALEGNLTIKDMDTIDETTNNLERAIAGLTAVLYDEVSAAYNTYNYIKSAIDSGDKLYSADSAAAFNEAWNKISTLMNYAVSCDQQGITADKYSQDEVDAAVDAIEDAVTNLQELQVECYLTKAPTLTDDGTYNERSFYTDSEGKQVVVSEALLGEGESVSFADWYLRTAVQYKDNADGSLTLRFVSMLDDTENFQEAGFKLSMGDNVLETLTTDKAYTSFVVDEKTVDMSQYSEDGGYFFISDYDYENYESYKNYVLSVESYVKTLEGDVITGNAVKFTMNAFFFE